MPDRYAVIGNPIEHSLSPVIHEAFAKQTQQSLIYERCLSPLDQFIPTVRQFIALGGRGLNVTHPFKEQAWALVDKYSERAAQAKAVNTILCQPDGSLYGDNTDGVGLVRDLTVNLKWPVHDQRILVLGAGGAVRGVLGPLLAESPASITIANRTLEKVQKLAQEFPVLVCSLDKISDLSFDVIINGTAMGFSDPSVLNIANNLKKGFYAYDMSYAKQSTPFLQWAHHKGAVATSDGFGMLVEQATESFFLWRGVRPDTQPILKKRIIFESTLLNGYSNSKFPK
jgi:shikimate dehydrogenase